MSHFRPGLWRLFSVVVVIAFLCVAVGCGRQAEESKTSSYPVGKRVSDFPPDKDFSSPAAACATINRDYMATGASDAEWAAISKVEIGNDPRKHDVAPGKAKAYRSARIVEVMVYKGRLAQVTAEIHRENRTEYDLRFLFLDKQRWWNVGNEIAPTLEEARKDFAKKSEYIYGYTLGQTVAAARWRRQPVSDPDAYLKPYVDFLKQKGEEPHAFLMAAFKDHELVIMGEVHNRPKYWQFNAELVRDKAFAELVGTIYMELPSNHQENIDRFLSQATCEKEIVVNMLRDMMEAGWPCKSTLDFLVAVWETNRALPPDKRLRICLVDIQRPWEKIRVREDWKKYDDGDRDSFMAKNILKDRQTANGKRRHGFFIVGVAHTATGLRYADRKSPVKLAGWHLKQAMGKQLFTVFQHAPVMTNDGDVSGRLALGLIDTAIGQLGDRPVAFTLQEGPYGKLPFDAMPDMHAWGEFKDGYDAYLYLTPLENEIHSSLIEGFYTEKYAAEIDRRLQMYGQHDTVITAAQLIALRPGFWGQPRTWTWQLGPRTAWHYGDEWRNRIIREHHVNVTREELTAVLDNVYRGIKGLDPNKYKENTWERAFGFSYRTWSGWSGMYKWWSEVTREHPLESVRYGKLSKSKEGLPQLKVTTTLRGGITFSKTFEFKYDAGRGGWECRYGLDMHLDPQWRVSRGGLNAASYGQVKTGQ